MSDSNETTAHATPLPLYLNPFHFSAGVDLTFENFHLIQNFTCGRAGQEETIYEKDVSDWIKDTSAEGAVESANIRFAEVKLFLHEDGRVIGYGAIGKVIWKFLGAEHTVFLIHYAGIHTDFRGQPNVPIPERFGRRLLGGLVEEIQKRNETRFMALYVDVNNPAQKLYEEFGFAVLDIETEGERQWIRMIRELQ